MSPKWSIHFIASSPGSAEPEIDVIRSEERSYRFSVSSGRARIRCSITGTTASTWQSCSSTAFSVSSSEKRRRRTIVEASGSESTKWVKPQE